ncbi:MAG: HU family DNA-binding protein [Bacteroidaceae bacterium]|nr:HU family DNA-binding protein [Bacteroidaceae bacterium]
MNNKDFTLELAKRLKLSTNDTSDMMAKLVSCMTDQWQSGNVISIQTFGNFEVRKKNERVSFHPSTKQKILIPPKLILTFKPSNYLKGKLK